MACVSASHRLINTPHMNPIISSLAELLLAGLASLFDYLAAHVLLCLLPAFLIAGFLSAMIPPEAISRYLGPKAPKWISYPASAAAGFLLAVCSCTILPLFAGIWKRGAGLGPAVTFLFVGPAVNILAITYTGAAIGFDIALARLVFSIVFGILIGMIMARVFRREETEKSSQEEAAGPFASQTRVNPAIWTLLLLLIAILVVGTLQVDFLSNPFAMLPVSLQWSGPVAGAFSATGLTLHGAILLFLIVLIGISGWKGFATITEKFNRWTYAALIFIFLTMLLAALPIDVNQRLGLNLRFIVEVLLIAAVVIFARSRFTQEQLAEWIWETWKFIRQIFPLLLAGVFGAGILREVIPTDWVRAVAGQNTIWSNLAGVVFGVVMYFPTLVEVPVAKMFLDLGMARGPLLAYLLADPELSLQSVLVLNKIMGKKKTAVYVGLVAIFTTCAGYLFGLALTLSAG